MATAIECPYCGRTCHTEKTIKPGAKLRCPQCQNLFGFYIHPNGMVEARAQGGSGGQPVALPQRAGGAPDAPTRTIFTTRRKDHSNRGYRPFEKSRDYIGFLTLIGIVTVVSFSIYIYANFIKTTEHAIGKNAGVAARQRQDKKAIEKQKQVEKDRYQRALEQTRKLQQAQSGEGSPGGQQP